LSWRRKLDDYKSLPSAGIEISNDGTPRFPDAFVPSEELDLFLARKTASSAMVEDLSMLPNQSAVDQKIIAPFGW